MERQPTTTARHADRRPAAAVMPKEVKRPTSAAASAGTISRLVLPGSMPAMARKDHRSTG